MQNSFRKFKKIPLAISTVLLLLSVFLFFFIYKNIQDSNKIFTEAQTKWQQEESKRSEIKSLERFLSITAEDRVSLDSHFIRSSDVVPFLDSIEKLAPQVKATTEVTSVDISPGNTSLAVGIKASGTFEGLYKFLTLLENSPYQIEFVSMNMRKIEDETLSKGVAPQWSAIFKIKLLSFME